LLLHRVPLSCQNTFLNHPQHPGSPHHLYNFGACPSGLLLPTVSAVLIYDCYYYLSHLSQVRDGRSTPAAEKTFRGDNPLQPCLFCTLPNARPYPSRTPRVQSNSCGSRQLWRIRRYGNWQHPVIPVLLCVSLFRSEPGWAIAFRRLVLPSALPLSLCVFRSTTTTTIGDPYLPTNSAAPTSVSLQQFHPTVSFGLTCATCDPLSFVGEYPARGASRGRRWGQRMPASWGYYYYYLNVSDAPEAVRGAAASLSMSTALAPPPFLCIRSPCVVPRRRVYSVQPSDARVFRSPIPSWWVHGPRTSLWRC